VRQDNRQEIDKDISPRYEEIIIKQARLKKSVSEITRAGPFHHLIQPRTYSRLPGQLRVRASTSTIVGRARKSLSFLHGEPLRRRRSRAEASTSLNPTFPLVTRAMSTRLAVSKSRPIRDTRRPLPACKVAEAPLSPGVRAGSRRAAGRGSVWPERGRGTRGARVSPRRARRRGRREGGGGQEEEWGTGAGRAHDSPSCARAVGAERHPPPRAKCTRVWVHVNALLAAPGGFPSSFYPSSRAVEQPRAIRRLSCSTPRRRHGCATARRDTASSSRGLGIVPSRRPSRQFRHLRRLLAITEPRVVD